MRNLMRLLILLSLATAWGSLSVEEVQAQSRIQHEHRLRDLEERVNRLVELEMWQEDRRSELETSVRESRQEIKALSGVNAELRGEIASQKAVLNQLRRDQETLRQRLQAMESASRSTIPPPQPKHTSAAYRVVPLRIVSPSASPPQVSGFNRAQLARPSERPPNGYSWPKPSAH